MKPKSMRSIQKTSAPAATNLIPIRWLLLPYLLLLTCVVDPSGLRAQFIGGALVNNQDLKSKAWHITNRSNDMNLSPSLGKLRNNTFNQGTSATWIIEETPDDGKWWTPDQKWFAIRHAGSGLYVTIENTITAGKGRDVGFAELGEPFSDLMKRQQFEVVWVIGTYYKIRSRTSGSGTWGNLILRCDDDGITYAVENNVSGERVSFAFNLALPSEDDRIYSMIGINNNNFISDRGISTKNTPLLHYEDHDQSAFWNFIRSGDGDFYHIRNALTGNYISNNGNDGDNAPLVMKLAPDESTKWELIRSGAHVRIRSKGGGTTIPQFIGIFGLQASGNQLRGSKSNVIGIQWVLTPIYDQEPEPIPGDFNRIPIELSCKLFMNGFKQAILERAGLPPEIEYWPIVVQALTNYYDGNAEMAFHALGNYELNNTGHRAELIHALKMYILNDVAVRSAADRTPLEEQTLQYFNEKIRDIRVHYGNRLSQSWNEFIMGQYDQLSGAGFSALLNAATNTNFEWPSDYDMSEFHFDAMVDLAVANKTFGLNNNQLNYAYSGAASIVGGTFVAILINKLIYKGAVGAINGFVAAGKFNAVQAKFAFSKVANAVTTAITGNATNSVSAMLGSAIGSAGTVVTVVVIAAQVLAAQITQAVEFQRLENKVVDRIAWSQHQVSIVAIMAGYDELAKIRLVTDMEFVLSSHLGASAFLHNTDDNIVSPPALAVNCQDVTVSLDGNCTAMLMPIDIWPGALNIYCGGVHQSFLSKSSFNVGDVGVQEVHLTASNSSSMASCTATVTIQDSIPPTVICQPATVYLNPLGMVTLLPEQVFQSGADNCGGVNILGVTPNIFYCSDVGTRTVELLVSDVHGNQNTCSAQVTIVDQMPPFALCQNTIVLLDANGQASISPLDVEGSPPFSSADNCGIAGFGLDSQVFNCAHVGQQNVVTLTVTDLSNNSSTCTATVTVLDQIAPTALCHDITVHLDEAGEAAISPDDVDGDGQSLSYDNCAIASLSLNRSEFFCDDLGENSVILTVTDVHDNSSTCSALVIVVDYQQPEIACPDDIVTGNDSGLCSAVVDYLIWADDNCDFYLVQTGGLASGTHFPVGVTSNIWQVTDVSGNTATCSFSVTVTKTGDPDLLWAYTVIALDEVKMKRNTVEIGGIGMLDTKKDKVKLEQTTLVLAPNTFVTAPHIDFKSGSQVAVHYEKHFNPALLPEFLPPSADCKNKIDIPNNSAPITLTGDCYGNIKVGKNATVIFSGQPDVNVKDLDLKEGATVLFEQNTTLRVNKKLDTDKNVTISRNGHTVWLHVDDQVKIDRGNDISVNIYAQKRLRVDKATASDPTRLSGLFIADKVDAHDHVFWSWDSLTCPYEQPVMNLTGLPDFSALGWESNGDLVVDLNWTNELDQEVVSYTVEKSTDGDAFVTVIKAYSHQVVDSRLPYRNADPTPAPGTWYYRLRLDKQDGSIAHTAPERVVLTLPHELTVFPNPASEVVYIAMPDQAGKEVSIQMLNAQGLVVAKRFVEELPAEPMMWDLGDIRDGLYMIQVQVEGRPTRVLRLAVAK